MRNILYKIFTFLLVGLLLIIMFPFMLGYTLLSSFWKVFGATIIAFIIIAMLGGTMEECLKYSSSFGFFVGILLTFGERSKD